MIVPAQIAEDLVNRALFTIGDTPVTLASLIVVALILILTFLLSKLVQRGIHRAMQRKASSDVGTVNVASRLLHYAFLMVGFGIALQTVGINVGALFAAGAFFAVALGFAMQNVAENFVAGVILLSERTIKPGDILRVQDTMVRVSHIGLRATVVRSRDEEDLIIPNSKLVQDTVTNYTLRDSLIRVRANVGVSYGSDVALVMKVLRETAEAVPRRVTEMEPLVLMTGFGDSSVNFEVSIWISQPWDSRRTLSLLYEGIWWALKANDVTIPFPQRDVHLYKQA